MAAGKENNTTTVERASDRELVVRRSFNAPARIVYEAWTKPELFKRWWVPKSAGMTMVSCELDVRTGGSYRLVFQHPAFPEPMAFFGRYIDVVPNARMVWTNDEAGEGGAITTLTFEAKDGRTLVTKRDIFPSKEALDAEIASGATSGFEEQFAQLDEVLVSQ